MIDLYRYIEEEFEDDRELVSYIYCKTFQNAYVIKEKGIQLYIKNENEILKTRKLYELHFHNFLKHQLFNRLQEIKYYSNVNVFDTRRLIAVSADCISMIQIVIRNKIHLNVHFRSSDFDGALPADLEFLASLPSVLIQHLQDFYNTPGYDEVEFLYIKKLEETPVQLNLTFGSLHRTNKLTN